MDKINIIANELNILPPMTDAQIEELRELFREMF